MENLDKRFLIRLDSDLHGRMQEVKKDNTINFSEEIRNFLEFIVTRFEKIEIGKTTSMKIK